MGEISGWPEPGKQTTQALASKDDLAKVIGDR